LEVHTMKQYKGLYIDHVTFHSEAEVDTFLKDQDIKKYKQLCLWFAQKPDLGLSIACNEKAEYLNRVYDMDWDELEAIETEAYRAC
jgi:hypothetical protein